MCRISFYIENERRYVMSDFNANLEKLFSNWKSEQKYSEYSKASSKQKKNTALWSAADVNGDGKISSKDKTAMNKLEKDDWMLYGRTCQILNDMKKLHREVGYITVIDWIKEIHHWRNTK